MKDMVLIIFGVFFFIHMLWIQLFIRYRIRKLRLYCNQFRQEGLLSSSEYEILLNRYSGIVKYLEWFPDKGDYPQLYLNKEFDKFSKRSRFISIYLAVSVVVIIVLGNLLAF